MNAREIGDAFKTHLTEFAITNSLPVAWPNMDFTPGVTPYLEMQFSPAPNDRLTLGDRTRTYGTLVITVVAAKGEGSGKAADVADAIADHFPVDLKLTTATNRLRITISPSIREGFRDGAHFRVPVTIPYEILI